MNFLPILLFFTAIILSAMANNCEVCKSSVKDIKAGKGLAYMAELSQQQIDDYVKKNVEKHCSSDCSKMIKDLIEIADQIDDDLDSTPEQLCQFVKYC